ncbi:sensor histidine kinase [Nesterenkonia haasae]|uniref:sensor histidine kinase n=1 Tax=Nesterenkonia haasae TaxID=2587813 RepID=UPI0013913BF5|nr:sensor histidine kinase [Nesterenkonia haasae]NDK32670.1 sensor histidine kinase [Nesterenkonia haasae]
MSFDDRSGPDPNTRIHQWLFDAVLGVAVFGVVAGTITANIDGDRDPESLAYLWAFVLGGLMLVRRRWPLAVLTLTVLGLWAYYAAGYPAIGLSVPTAAALFSAAEFRRVLWPVSAAVFLLTGSYFYRLAIAGQDPTRVVGYELAGHVALMTAAIALGISMRLRRDLRRSSRKLVEATAERERSQAAAAIATERADIARELHDSLGHRTTVISMHADVAREALDRDRQTAVHALEVVKSTSNEMMEEMRSTVRMLRRSEDPRGPVSLATLEDQVFSHLPLTVTAKIQAQDDEGNAPSQAVQIAAYRIVQEALTNVVRHSAAETAEVSVRHTDAQLRVSVRDPGPAALGSDEIAVDSGTRLGLYGMRERAEALGGRFTAGRWHEGFEVRAVLPTAVVSAGEKDQ